eukprot:6105483-Amphidinium_carterae.1
MACSQWNEEQQLRCDSPGGLTAEKQPYEDAYARAEACTVERMNMTSGMSVCETGTQANVTAVRLVRPTNGNGAFCARPPKLGGYPAGLIASSGYGP